MPHWRQLLARADRSSSATATAMAAILKQSRTRLWSGFSMLNGRTMFYGIIGGALQVLPHRQSPRCPTGRGVFPALLHFLPEWRLRLFGYVL